MAGFSYDATGGIPLRGPAPPQIPTAEGIVPSWSVSDAFPEEVVAAVHSLDPTELEQRTWTELVSESSGLADLSKVNAIRDERNTTFARATIRSASACTARLELGFSDRAAVFLNGRALYRGDDTYRSRDYRFLGSIGYFDVLYVALLEGDNELVVAVSESLGGWGVQARFSDPTGPVVRLSAAAAIAVCSQRTNRVSSGSRAPRRASRSISTHASPRASASVLACGLTRCAARTPSHAAVAGSRRIRSR